MLIEGSFGELNEKEMDSLKKVFESNERLIRLVENLLDISRIESGRLEYCFAPNRLENIANSVADELKSKAEEKGLKLIYKKSAKPLPKLNIDEQKIRQVIMNLVDNAVKYSTRGAITIELANQGKKGVLFCVSDEGMGIAPGDMPNLFKKFSRGKGVSLIHTGGSGLGLYVCKMMIEAHQGKIWLESEGAGKGAKFYFSLPIKTNLKNAAAKK